MFFFSSRRRHTRYIGDWSSDVCSSDMLGAAYLAVEPERGVQVMITTFQLPEGLSQPEREGLRTQFASERSEERRVGEEWKGGARAARASERMESSSVTAAQRTKRCCRS